MFQEDAEKENFLWQWGRQKRLPSCQCVNYLFSASVAGHSKRPCLESLALPKGWLTIAHFGAYLLFGRTVLKAPQKSRTWIVGPPHTSEAETKNLDWIQLWSGYSSLSGRPMPGWGHSATIHGQCHLPCSRQGKCTWYTLQPPQWLRWTPDAPEGPWPVIKYGHFKVSYTQVARARLLACAVWCPGVLSWQLNISSWVIARGLCGPTQWHRQGSPSDLTATSLSQVHDILE